MKQKLFFLLVAVMTSLLPARALDKIILTTGETIVGMITRESKSSITIRTGSYVEKYKLQKIKEIHYDSGLMRFFENGVPQKSIKDPESNVVFYNREQKWEFVDAILEGGYTKITFNITLLSNGAGCFDAHNYDKRNSEIFISGEMGRRNIVKTTYVGDYEAWEMYPGYLNPEYFAGWQKGKIVTATLYFARVPLGVQFIDLNFKGGTANPSAPGNDVCPVFTMKDIFLESNSNSTIRSKWTEMGLKEYWSTNKIYPLEGIYAFWRTNNEIYWGENRHRIAIKKEDNYYDILYLDGANNSVWSIGELKGRCSATKTKSVYKIDLWYLENKQEALESLYIKYYDNGVTIYDADGHVSTDFIKLYPQEDMEGGDLNVTPNHPTEEERLKGTGSGFFVGKDVIATNFHVVEDAKNIKIVISDKNSVNLYDAKIMCVDKANDLALIQIIDSKFVALERLPYKIAQRSSDVGVSVFSAGYPYAKNGMGEEIKITDGIISSKTGAGGDVVRYQISAPIQPGNSGGPLFDKHGNIVGITSSGMKGLDNVGYAIKSVYLNNLIDSSPVNIKDITSNQIEGMSLPSMIRAISPYVTMILVY